MKRYYLSDIIGDGSMENAYRPAIADLGVNHVPVIDADENGVPLTPWALVLVDTPNHARVRNTAGVDPLPDVSLDVKVAAIQQATKTAMVNAMARRGIPTDFVGGADGYRDVIRGIGRQLDVAFDEDNLDVSA